jgi:hypothetical protein
MEPEAVTMAYSLIVIGATLGVFGVFAWWVHRHQRDIDAYEEREYRVPLVFQLPRGPIG